MCSIAGGCIVAQTYRFFVVRFHKDWLESLKDLEVPLHQVDAHNIVPVWVTSEKQEYAARTIRSSKTTTIMILC